MVKLTTSFGAENDSHHSQGASKKRCQPRKSKPLTETAVVVPERVVLGKTLSTFVNHLICEHGFLETGRKKSKHCSYQLFHPGGCRQRKKSLEYALRIVKDNNVLIVEIFFKVLYKWPRNLLYRVRNKNDNMLEDLDKIYGFLSTRGIHISLGPKTSPVNHFDKDLDAAGNVEEGLAEGNGSHSFAATSSILSQGTNEHFGHSLVPWERMDGDAAEGQIFDSLEIEAGCFCLNALGFHAKL